MLPRKEASTQPRVSCSERVPPNETLPEGGTGQCCVNTVGVLATLQIHPTGKVSSEPHEPRDSGVHNAFCKLNVDE